MPTTTADRLKLRKVTRTVTRRWIAKVAKSLSAEDRRHGYVVGAGGTDCPVHAYPSSYGDTYWEARPRRARLNTHHEWIMGTIRAKALPHPNPGEAHARQVLTTYGDHHNRHRPRQARDRLHPRPCASLQYSTSSSARLFRTRILDGFINEDRSTA
ncbi:MAG: hypothetical protein ABIQ18_20580 [Umezawaea sp.]